VSTSVQERVFDGAADWTDRHLELFDPAQSDPPAPWAEVPLSELAILALMAWRRQGPAVDPRVRRWTSFIADVAARPRFAERPFRRPETLVSHLLIGTLLAHASGADLVGWRRRVETLLRSSNLAAPSLAPHRMLELRHAADLAGVEHDLGSYAQLYRATLLGSPINPIFASRSDAYLVTHVVFYMTDLGHRSPALLGVRERARVGRLADQLTGLYLCTNNWDLTAELLLTSWCLERPNAFHHPAWTMLEQAQDSDGSVPGYTWREPGTPGHGPTGDDRFTLRYHTTLVSALAATACG